MVPASYHATPWLFALLLLQQSALGSTLQFRHVRATIMRGGARGRLARSHHTLVMNGSDDDRVTDPRDMEWILDGEVMSTTSETVASSVAYADSSNTEFLLAGPTSSGRGGNPLNKRKEGRIRKVGMVLRDTTVTASTITIDATAPKAAKPHLTCHPSCAIATRWFCRSMPTTR